MEDAEDELMEAVSRPGLDRRARMGVVIGVGALHAGFLILLGLGVAPSPFIPPPPIFDIVLTRPLPPLPDAPVDRRAGDGAPAAPSRIHTPPDPPLEKVELPAPRALALEPALVVGLSPLASPDLGLGQGGEGTGRGDGVGPGDGSGSGAGSGPVLVEGPARATITEDVQRASLYDKPGSHVVMRCTLRLTQRLERCRVVGEHPTPSGLRADALRRSREFRIKPPVRDGRPRDRYDITVAIAFPPPPAPITIPEDEPAG